MIKNLESRLEVLEVCVKLLTEIIHQIKRDDWVPIKDAGLKLNVSDKSIGRRITLGLAKHNQHYRYCVSRIYINVVEFGRLLGGQA